MRIVALLALVCLASARSFPKDDVNRRVVLQYGQLINGQQTVPQNPVTGTAASHVWFDTETFTISWIIGYVGLTGPATAAHFHGPANRTENAGVQIDIGAISGTQNPMVGAASLTAQQGQQLLAGEFYINIHTSQYPAGEIRGQVVDTNFLNYGQQLNTLQEVPPTFSSGHGTSHVTLDPASSTLSWRLAWASLTGPATLVHFHGDAPIGINSGVQVDIGPLSGLTSPNVGAVVLNPAQMAGLMAGHWYLNIHTAANPAGEIRGQVTPSNILVLAANLNGNNEVPPVATNASGVIQAFLDTVTGSLSWILTYNNLSAPPTLAHFHGPAPPGVNAGVRIDIAAVSGLASPMTGIVTTDARQIQEFMEGLMYANVHTTVNPGGEIRGQMIRVAKMQN